MTVKNHLKYSDELNYIEINCSDISDTGKRLDLYLSLQLPQYSRSFIKKTIEENKVFVNEDICFKAGYKVQLQDKIKFPKLEYKPNSVDLFKAKFDLEIISEDEDYLFINKPINLAVHPTSSMSEITLVNKLLGLYSDLPSNDFRRPGIVHRLDKDTSGVIVIAKNPKSLWWLSGQFANRKVHKKYVSIGVDFQAEKKLQVGSEFEVQGMMKRNTLNRKHFFISTDEKSGKFSYSRFLVKSIKEVGLSKLYLLEIYPLTGRTHQIRVHQKSIDLPILGDKIYLSRKQMQWSDKFLQDNAYVRRLYLHAKSISFENYNGKLYSVETKVPEEFSHILS